MDDVIDWLDAMILPALGQLLLWSPVMLSWCLVSIAAVRLAHYKQRPDKALRWGLLCFVLPISLPVLTAWKLKPIGPPLPDYLPAQSLPSLPFIVVMGNLIVIAQVVGIAYVSVLHGNLTGLPMCWSHYVAERIRGSHAVSSERVGLSIGIVNLSEARERDMPAAPLSLGGRTIPPPIRHCTALASLRNGSSQNINYVVHENLPHNYATPLPPGPSGEVHHMAIFSDGVVRGGGPSFKFLAWQRDPEFWTTSLYEDGMTPVRR